MTRHRAGWAFVAVQAVLLLALVFLPRQDDWPSPTWLTSIGYITILVGLAVVALASIRLGPALTPTPVPTERCALITTGLYRQMRHPIYSGVLAVVAGLTIRSSSFISLGVAAGTIVFFNLKARWEEAQLAQRYPGYDRYAATTPRFLPRPKRVSGTRAKPGDHPSR